MERILYKHIDMSERKYMKNFGKKFAVAAISGIISLAASMTAFAASGIKSVKINIKSDAITVGKDRDINDITVNVSGSNYYIDGVDFMDMGTTWESTDTPKITVHLSANDNYYFSVYKAEDFKITGGELIEARRENSSNDLYVDIQLPALINQVSPIETVNLSGNGVQSFTTNSANFKSLMTKSGTYTLKVRAVNGDGTKSSAWVSSSTVTISQAEAANNYNESKNATTLQGTWQRNATGWWYAFSDGTYVTSSWKQIGGEWYYFNADGYMLVGWQNIGGNWYYMDLNRGNMLSNTTTPDGYFVNESGVYVAI